VKKKHEENKRKFSRQFGRSNSAILLAATIAAACGPRVSQNEQAVMKGTSATIENWPGVVGLIGLHPETKEEAAFCSGSLIAPKIVLTAGHCLKTASVPDSVDPVKIRFNTSNLGSGGDDVTVDKTVVVSDDFDLGLVFLTKDAPVSPIPLARSCGAATEGGKVTLTAYGTTSESDMGTLNTVELTVAKLACTEFELGCASFGASGSYLVSTPGGMCGGDSGGPLFVVNQYGKFVAGVVSGPVQTETSDECIDWQQALYPRPDTVVAWIEEQIGEKLMEPTCTAGTGGTGGTSGTGGTGGTAGSGAVPIDDGGCATIAGQGSLASLLLALGLVGIVFRRRRRS
jgi:trypsin